MCGVTSATLAANTPTVGTGAWSIVSGAGGSFALNTDPSTTVTGTLRNYVCITLDNQQCTMYSKYR
ncbi:MAG: hypothetical protein IPO70_15740 [Bacteroidetes bacterium]|nr:hypothetical protein [Bacteroidota bacterium]